MKQVLFFGLKKDLMPMFELVESKGPLKYFRMGIFPKHQIEEGVHAFDSGGEIPHLGKATADSSAACETFLVCQRETSINFRVVQGSNGERVCIDQLANPDSVEFKPGGIWSEDVVLHGRIATASESQISQVLMKRFQAGLKKTFSKVKAFFVGPNALVLLESGSRLTISAQSPREFDLTRAIAKS